MAVHAPGEADANVYAYVSGKVLKNVDPLGLIDVGANERREHNQLRNDADYASGMEDYSYQTTLDAAYKSARKDIEDSKWVGSGSEGQPGVDPNGGARSPEEFAAAKQARLDALDAWYRGMSVDRAGVNANYQKGWKYAEEKQQASETANMMVAMALMALPMEKLGVAAAKVAWRAAGKGVQAARSAYWARRGIWRDGPNW